MKPASWTRGLISQPCCLQSWGPFILTASFPMRDVPQGNPGKEPQDP